MSEHWPSYAQDDDYFVGRQERLRRKRSRVRRRKDVMLQAAGTPIAEERKDELQAQTPTAAPQAPPLSPPTEQPQRRHRAHDNPSIHQLLRDRSGTLGLPRILVHDNLEDSTNRIDKRFVVNLTSMHRLTLQNLREKLVDGVVKVNLDNYTDSDVTEFAETMATYCQALRDWDYMLESKQKSATPTDDPFKLVNTKLADLHIMYKSGILKYSGVTGKYRRNLHRFGLVVQDGKSHTELPPGGSRSRIQGHRNAEARVLRFFAATLGGLALVGPMVLLVLVKTTSPALSLATVGVCTILFALAIAITTEKGPLDVMSVTEAYAAILVVFVGTTS